MRSLDQFEPNSSLGIANATLSLTQLARLALVGGPNEMRGIDEEPEMTTDTTKRTEFVIQRASETLCEWWTGFGWSEQPEDARRYSEEPNVSQETGDESAKAQPLTQDEVAPI
jgi:hypothetical protein